jgi:signal transduction histidine kinase
MSHELRTPLNAIGGYLELLEIGLHGPVNEKQRDAYGRIRENTRHLLMLVNDVLSYAKLEAGRVDFDQEAVNAAEVLNSIGPLVTPLAARRGVVYAARECDRELAVRADVERLRQILLNLVTNGLKYTGTGGWVVLTCEARGEEVEFAVEDNGPGIPPEMQERIFDAFTQVDRRARDSREGVGLGLAISRDLARGMDGSLSVESEVGTGTKFTLRLPRAG